MPTPHLLLLVPLLAVVSPALGQSEPNPPVRVGVVAVEDLGREHDRWQANLAALSAATESIAFEIALGTYGDLLHWLEQGLVDVAILTPGVYAESLLRDAPHSFDYVATLSTPPATSPWADPPRRAPGDHYQYRSICLVREDAPIRDTQTLRDMAARDALEFVFVHPLSMSGRVIPERVLGDLGIPTQGRVTYSYSHSRSLELLAKPAPTNRHRVAFVWDDATTTPPSPPSARRVPVPGLDETDIPHDLVVVRRDHPQRRALQTLFSSEKAQSLGLTAVPQAAQEYQRLATWLQQVRPWRADGLPLGPDEELNQVSLAEIGQILLHSGRALNTPPRLAVVMAGGGAKCSYQAGAIAALEEELRKLRSEAPDLDIHLVVGTSGGAINSLPVALGITAEPPGVREFHQVWLQLDQRELVRPSPIVRINLGLWFAIVQIALASRAVQWLSEDRRARTFGALLLLLGVVQIVLGYIAPAPWKFLGTSHVVHHAWLWCSLGLRPAAWCMTAAGVTFFLIWHRRVPAFLMTPSRQTRLAYAVCLTALPLLQVFTVLFGQTTLSGGVGVERALSQHFPTLINSTLARDGADALDLARAPTQAARLKQTSAHIVGNPLLKRDLVITGNCLAQSSGKLPSDLYFYASAQEEAPAPPFGARGIDLRQHPDILLDVIMGSSAIFPLFPPRRIEGLPAAGDHVELIDGGFAHNSPTEAAVLWGATHVILLETTPAHRGPRRNLIENTSAAFVHLHKQTQLVDTRSKRSVDVFTLTPQPPHICVLDFADNLMAASIARGYADARGADGSRRFRKEPGAPQFSPVQSPAAAAN